MPGLKTDGLAVPWMSARDTLKFTWAQLETRTRRRLVVATLLLSFLSVGDFLAVFMLAAVTGLVVASLTPESSFETSWLPVESLSPAIAIGALGGGAVVLMALKTYVSWKLIKRVRLFLARLQPSLSGRVYQSYLRAPYPSAQMLTRSQVGGAVNTGPSSLLMALNAVISMAADLTLLLLMVALLLLGSPVLFIAAAAYFALLTFVTSRLIGRRMSYYGREGYAASLAAGETTQASVGFASEIRLYGMADGFGKRLAFDQERAASLSAHQQLLFQAPRYIFEMGVLAGFVAVAGVALYFQGPADAAFTVALFSLTSVRLVPALQRLNGSWGSLKLGRAQSCALAPVLDLPPPDTSTSRIEVDGSCDDPLVLEGVSYRYPASEVWALSDVSLRIKRGSMVALVGRTGSGKSTLAGVIAGLIEPTSGTIRRAGGAEWRERLAVVRQDVYLAPDTVRNNIALPVLGQTSDDDRLWAALEQAQVADVVAALPGALDAELGEEGARVSGGEAQRLGLARALYRQPTLLVLDEATSSLDAQTESKVAEAIQAASKKRTLVVVAHRLSTIRDADQVVFMDGGRVLATGSFAEVAANVPSFAEAARLQGLMERANESPSHDAASSHHPRSRA